MILAHDERTLLLLYYENDREQTLHNLQSMQKELQTDEEELYGLTAGVIVKLSSMTDRDFQELNLFEEMEVRT